MLLVIAVVLMLGGAGLLVFSASAGIGFPLVAIGIALTVVLENERRRGRRASR